MTSTGELPNHRPKRPPPLVDTCNIFSFICFQFIQPLILFGRKNEISEDHLHDLGKRDEVGQLTKRLVREWSIQAKKENPSFWKTCWRVFGPYYGLTFFIGCIEATAQIAEAVILGYLIRFFQNEDAPMREGYLYALTLALCTFIHSIIHHHYYFPALRTGLHMRMGLIALMYRKCLSLSVSSAISTGAIVNLISNDVQPFENASSVATWLIIGPLQGIVVIVLLYREIGPSVFAGLCAFLVLLPLQGYFAKRFSYMREETVKYRDDRIRSLSDVLSGINLVKLSAWEDALRQCISELREKELKYIGKANNMRAFNMASYFFFQSVISVFTFITYWALGEPFRADKVFVSLTLFNVMRMTMANYFPQALASFAEARVSANRIKEFLLLPELKPLESSKETVDKSSEAEHSTSFDETGEDSKMDAKKNDIESSVKSNFILEMNNASFRWSIFADSEPSGAKVSNIVIDSETNKNTDHSVLRSLPLKLGFQELLAVVGPVGAGKTSLCMAILKELHMSHGTMHIATGADGEPIKIAYAAQSPWLFAGSIRENILFGATYEAGRFQKVIQVCQLDRDFTILSNGEHTIIGERGVTLSGGQRARVALARAVYQRADLYILDDPLSAVDPHVGYKMFNECIQGFLKNKAVILATHQLQYVKDCDSVMVLESGAPTFYGPSREILSVVGRSDEKVITDQYLRKTFIDVLREYYLSHDVSVAAEATDNVEAIGRSRKSSMSSLIPEGDSVVETSVEEYDPKANQLVAEDRNMEGTSIRTYLEFFRLGSSNVYLCFVVLLLFVGQGFSVAADFYLSTWTGLDDEKQKSDVHAGIFSGLAILTVILGSIRALLFFKALHKSSENIFRVMLDAVLNTDMNFFQTQPQGRILNRFSKDQANCDELLPWNFFDAIQCFFMLLGSIVVVCITNPWIIIALPFLGFIFYTLRRFYMLTSRQIKQIESTTRSPVYSLLSETLDGLATIRAFSEQDRFLDMFIAAENENCRAFFMYLCSARWLGFRLDTLAATFLTITAFASVAVRETQSAGLVGLSLSYVLQLMGLLQWAVRQSIEVEITFVSVERMLSYTKLLPEGPRVTDVRPPKGWPQNAEIEFKEMSLTYPGSDKTVLRNINLKIRRHEKVGVVGRTGAGKSSLLTALFRLIEASPSGCILIDGIPISDLGLHDLRNAISIIPQEPFLFKGTLRFNLDPLNEHDDQSVWRALELAELKESINRLPQGLDTPVTENGKSFSIGQRQLLSLTRAILRNTQLLVMDEATANVDLQSDRFIQRSIHTCFRDATVLTIAHRLNTVIGDYDRILVLDQGEVMEFDEPWVLLQDEKGWLSDMVRSTGPESERDLRTVARQQWERVHNSIWDSN